MNKLNILENINIGSRVAEEERDNLNKYFIETNEYKRTLKDEVDIIYGAKGTGKSALYLSILKNYKKLNDDENIIVIQAESMQEASAFKSVVEDPPTSENTFRNIWKLYFLVLLYENFVSKYIFNRNYIRQVLFDSKLLGKDRSLMEVFSDAYRYIKNNSINSVEAKMSLDTNTGIPNGISGKITFSDTVDGINKGSVNIDKLFDSINNLLAKKKKRAWLMLDRLDSVFEGNDTLEENAIRGLFKAYLDMKKFSLIREKIFLRTDIWDKITKKGFREASHITRTANIEWTEQSIINLIVKRFTENEFITREYGIEKEKIISDYKNQENLFYKIFPEQVEKSEKKPVTIKWIITRTSDAKGIIAPREIIHLIIEMVALQVTYLKMGKDNTEAGNLFERSLFKLALDKVSTVKIEQTLFAEYPDMKEYIQKFIQQKATNSLESIIRIIGKSKDKSTEIIDRLIEIGFFTKTQTDGKAFYNIPFLYRPYLNSIQGKSE